MQSSADHDINLDNIESNVKEVISPETNILTLEDVIKHFPKRMQTRAQLLGSYLKKDGQNIVTESLIDNIFVNENFRETSELKRTESLLSYFSSVQFSFTKIYLSSFFLEQMKV